MKSSFRIAVLFGIPVYVHWTFLFIIAWILLVGQSRGQENYWVEVGVMFLIVFGLFTCVVMHEFGHALTAKRFGVNTRDIILSPIGGVARLDRLPEKPIHEFLVAIAGPLVNVAIALVLSLYFFIIQGHSYDYLVGMLPGNRSNFAIGAQAIDYAFPYLIGLNIMLAGFNLLPAFPMDGGRILRALLSMQLGRMMATRISAYIGQFFAVVLVAVGIFGIPGDFQTGNNIVFIFIGVFVYITATSEYRMVKMDAVLEQYKAIDIMRTTFTRIYKSDTMQMPYEVIKRGGLEQYFLVFDQWQNLSGVLLEEHITKALKKDRLQESVMEFVNYEYQYLLPEDSLKMVLTKMQEKEYKILPVYHKNNIIGVIDIVGLNNFLKMQQKSKKP